MLVNLGLLEPSGFRTELQKVNRLGITIIEITTGVWSGDAPARANGDNPIEFRGWSDPSDATNGINTPGNINDSDVWRELTAP